MSKLEELINELCPDGVEYKTFGSLVHTNLGGGTPSKSNKNYWNGAIPWASVKDVVRQGMYMRNTLDFITSLGLQNSPSNLIPAGWLIICTRINPGLCSITTGDVAINQDLRAIRFIDDVDVKFVYYYFQTMTIIGNGTTVKGISIEELEKLLIPLPPLPVQREIVLILDNFTELTAELTARKKQYEYYRNQLLSFNSKFSIKPIGDVCLFQNGFAFQSNKFTDKGNPILRIANIQGGRIDSNNLVYFDKNFYKENLTQYIVGKGDIVLAMSGATTGKIGYNDTNIQYYLNQRVGKFIPHLEIILNRYLYHVLSSKSQEIYQLAGGGAQPNLSSEQLKKMLIPVPSLEQQERIVSILDRFDALCNDLTSGLPAEIEARRKQYEYYRDKLLTFKEAKA